MIESSGEVDRRLEADAIRATWYPFLFAAIFVWGLLPRLILWMFAVYKERTALSSLDFQAKRHRELWREMMGTRRRDVSEAPLDGVLVLDVGGTGLGQDSLRGFLLRRLRVNPGEWHEVGVWDEKGEESAAISIRNAPAGVVLLGGGLGAFPTENECASLTDPQNRRAGYLCVFLGSELAETEAILWK